MDVQTATALTAMTSAKACGYPLDIMDGKPDEKFCCGYCKLILRDPMQNACGHRFCRGCMEIIQSLPSPVICQSCREEGMPEDESILKADEMFDDKAARREMRKLPIKCISPGCSWKGQFNDFIEHDENCEKKMVQCQMCHVHVSKAKMTNHMTKSCPKRNVPCQYCKEMIVYDNTENHNKTCPMYTIKCEGCGEKIARKDIMEHQEKTCTNRILTCPVPSCKVKLPSNQFIAHFSKETLKLEHIAYLLERIQSLDVELNALTLRHEHSAVGTVVPGSLSVPDIVAAEIGSADPVGGGTDTEGSRGDGAQADSSFQNEERQKLKLHEDLMSVLHSEILRCITKGEALGRGMEKEEKRVRDLYGQVENLLARMTDLEKRYIAKEQQQANTRLECGELSSEGNGIFMWRLPSFSDHRRKACNNTQLSVSSPYFFSEPSGYKMKLTLYPDGHGASKGKDLSLFLELESGPYDDLLLWPFNGKLCFMLIDQKDFARHHVKTCLSPDGVASTAQGPPASESLSLGLDDFIHREELAKRLNSFIIRDKIFIKVSVDPAPEVRERIASLDPRRAV